MKKKPGLPRLLIVDDEEATLRTLGHLFKDEACDVTECLGGKAGLAALERTAYDVVLTDLRMEGVDGMAVLARAGELHPDCAVILITGYATIDTAVDAMRQGAFHYIAKPFRIEEVRQVVRKAFEWVKLKRDNRQLREYVASEGGGVRIITQDRAMLQLLEVARQIAPTDCAVLVTGESGTGKELMARYVHAHGPRSRGPFVAVNCGALQENLLASELFGHERGAFTGADRLKHGLAEAAAGGTLFLDEIAEMSPVMQVKLLRLLQEKEITRVGGTAAIKVDLRFVAATNAHLQQAVADGRFRSDLYFRLNVVNLAMPPLRQRPDDIPLLATYFLHKFALAMNRPVTDISPAALAILGRYEFPGNVRELSNLIERAVALTRGELVGVGELPDSLRQLRIQVMPGADAGQRTLVEQEVSLIQDALQQAGGNRGKAARQLGIDRVSLWRKIKKYGLDS